MSPMPEKAVKKPSLETPWFYPIFRALGCSCSSHRAPAATCRPPAIPSPLCELVPVTQLQPSLERVLPWLWGVPLPGSRAPPVLPGPAGWRGKALPDSTSAFSVPRSPCLLRINPKKLRSAPCLTLVSPRGACSCLSDSAESPRAVPDPTPRCTALVHQLSWGGYRHQRGKSKLPAKRAASPNSGDRTQGLGEMTASKQHGKGCL